MGFDEHGRPGADGSPADWDDWEHLVIPDDIHELEADIRAYRREQRAVARRAVIHRVLFRTRFGVTLPVVLGALVLAAIYSVVMLVVASPRSEAPPRTALATSTLAVGRVGGLLPDVTLRDVDGTARSLRTLRPAVLLLAPAHCRCADMANAAASAAEHSRLSLTIIGTHMPRRPTGVSPSVAALRSERTGELLATYGAVHRPVTVLVRADGVVKQVLPKLPASGTLDDQVRALLATKS